MDERLRELERAWAQSRDPGVELLLVRERLRTGELRLAHLEVAAFLGSPTAQELTPIALVPPGLRFGSREWSVLLYRRFGPHLARRFELGLLRTFLPTWQRLCDEDDLFPRLLERMGRYLLDPTQRAALVATLREPPSDVAVEVRLRRCEERRLNATLVGNELSLGSQPPLLVRDLVCACPEHVALGLARSYGSRVLLAPPSEPADYFGSPLLEALSTSHVRHRHPYGDAVRAAAGELLRWALGHEELLGPKRKLLVSVEAEEGDAEVVSPEQLTAAEEAAERAPEDLGVLRELVRLSEAAGWRQGRYSLAGYRKLLRTSGTRSEEIESGREVAQLGLRAVPLALDALPRHVACQALQCLGERAVAAIPRLIELLQHDDSAVRRDAVRVLEAIGPALVLEPVRAALEQSDYVHGPLYLLLAFGEDPHALEPYLRRAFANGRYRELLGHPRAEVLTPVVDLVSEIAVSERHAHSQTAIRALGRLGSAGVPALEQILARLGQHDHRRELVDRQLSRLRGE